MPTRPDGITPSQTVGPYFAYGLTPTDYAVRPLFSNDLAVPGLEGRPIRLEGGVFDGDGAPIEDAMIEIWQADARGFYAGADAGARGNAAFSGFGRVESKGGRYAFTTILPGASPLDPDEAPHIKMTVFARGLLHHLHTRVYFEGEPSNAHDPTLALVPAARRATLIAVRSGDPASSDRGTYRFDVHLQGERETVFFEI